MIWKFKGEFFVKKMNVAEKFIKSIIDIKSYLVFLKERTGKAILYILLLSIILGGIKGFNVSRNIQKAINEAKNYLTENEDTFKLENGELTVGENPILIKEEGVLVLVDTSYTYESYGQKQLADLNLENYINSVLVFKDRVIVNNNGQQTVQNFSEITTNIYPGDIINILNAASIVGVFILLFYIVGGFIGNLLWALIITLVGTVASYIIKVKIKFKGLYRISLYAITLPAVIHTIFVSASIVVPMFSLIFLVISMVYVYLALKLIKKELTEEELFIIG